MANVGVSHRQLVDKYLDLDLPVKQLGRLCRRPLPKVIIARWRTARIITSLFLPSQSQRSSFTVIGYAEAAGRTSPMTCRLL